MLLIETLGELFEDVLNFRLFLLENLKEIIKESIKEFLKKSLRFSEENFRMNPLKTF